MDKRRINGLLEAINEREHCDHTWVDKRRINGLCLLDRSFGKCGLFLSQSWTVSRYRYMRYSVFRYLASANGGRSAIGGKCGAVCLVPPPPRVEDRPRGERDSRRGDLFDFFPPGISKKKKKIELIEEHKPSKMNHEDQMKINFNAKDKDR